MRSRVVNCNCCGIEIYQRRYDHYHCSKKCYNKVYRENCMRFSQNDEKDKTIREKIISRLGEDGYKKWEEDCVALFNLEMEKRKSVKREEIKERKINKPAKNHPWRNGTFLKKVPRDDY